MKSDPSDTFKANTSAGADPNNPRGSLPTSPAPRTQLDTFLRPPRTAQDLLNQILEVTVCHDRDPVTASIRLPPVSPHAAQSSDSSGRGKQVGPGSARRGGGSQDSSQLRSSTKIIFVLTGDLRKREDEGADESAPGTRRAG